MSNKVMTKRSVLLLFILLSSSFLFVESPDSGSMIGASGLRSTSSLSGQASGADPIKSPSIAHNNRDYGVSEVEELLAKYLFTKDKTWFKEAMRLYPDDPDVLLEACLIADRPDSPDLENFERLHPNNALPNLIRAGLFARLGDLNSFKNEFRLALSKSGVSTDEKRRRAILLDYLLANHAQGIDSEVYQGVDPNFHSALSHIYGALSDHPQLFGDEFSTAEMVIKFGQQLRGMEETSLSGELMAIQYEKLLLEKLDSHDLYGTEGQTIGERVSELEQQFMDIGDVVVKYVHPLMDSGGDPALRLRFFTRVHTDGERAAVDWLAGEMGSTNPSVSP